MTAEIYKISSATQKIFPGLSDWVHVTVSREQTDDLSKNSHFGMKSVAASVDETTRKTTLMSIGDGTYLIALKAALRKKENISIGDTIQLSFSFA